MFTPSEKRFIARTLKKKICDLLKLCIQQPCAGLILHFPPLCSHQTTPAARTAARVRVQEEPLINADSFWRKLRPVIRFRGRPAAWESILPARRAARLKMTIRSLHRTLTHAPLPPPPSTPPSPPSGSLQSHSVCVCALWGFASAVRVAHSSFPVHRRFVSPRYLHYRRHTQITWEKLGGETEYERFIVLAEFIKMEQSCRCAYVIDLMMICDGFMCCVFVFLKKTNSHPPGLILDNCL